MGNEAKRKSPLPLLVACAIDAVLGVLELDLAHWVWLRR